MIVLIQPFGCHTLINDSIRSSTERLNLLVFWLPSQTFFTSYSMYCVGRHAEYTERESYKQMHMDFRPLLYS